ncbi:hypothetical protein BGZ60DRAFT_418822 [Tricladium varicosporioides]|nr:hypothetical protein BGZ60DRAFT_418822 [Hymenoscyphus varicosporioides]
MPCLTLKGFIDVCALEALSDPERAWHDLNRMLRFYQLDAWKERGDIPRSSLPAESVEKFRLSIEDLGIVIEDEKTLVGQDIPALDFLDVNVISECRF